MQKQKLILIIGVALAIGAAFMVNTYIEQQRQNIQEQAKQAVAHIQANQAAVLVAKQELPPGTVIEPDMLEVAIIPAEYVQPQAVSSLDRIAGMTTLAAIPAGEQLTLNKLSQQQRQMQQAGGSGGSLAMATPIGKRAITISVDNISSLLGMVKPGDYVDVIGLLPVPVQTPEGKQASQSAVIPLFQNVLILAVGQDTGRPAAGPPGSRYKEESKEVSPYITLALAPQEASLIAFVQEQGKLRLVLRSPTDSQIEPVQPANWETLFHYIMPAQTKEAGGRPQAAEGFSTADDSGYTVEIYRGLNKERIPISK